MKTKGAIAAGHPETAGAAGAILEEGGNAFDAALAAMCVACVAEPVLAFLGGGGFLLARRGVAINGFQAYILGVVGRIYVSTAECRALFGGADENDRPMGEGGELRMPAFAGTLEALAREGEDLFYRGEVARRIAEDYGPAAAS